MRHPVSQTECESPRADAYDDALSAQTHSRSAACNKPRSRPYLARSPRLRRSSRRQDCRHRPARAALLRRTSPRQYAVQRTPLLDGMEANEQPVTIDAYRPMIYCAGDIARNGSAPTIGVTREALRHRPFPRHRRNTDHEIPVIPHETTFHDSPRRTPVSVQRLVRPHALEPGMVLA